MNDIVYMAELMIMRFSALLPKQAEPEQETLPQPARSSAQQQGCAALEPKQETLQGQAGKAAEPSIEILVHVNNVALVLPASSQCVTRPMHPWSTCRTVADVSPCSSSLSNKHFPSLLLRNRECGSM